MRHLVQRIVRGVIFCTVSIAIMSCAGTIDRSGSEQSPNVTVDKSEENLPRIDAIRLRVARNALANGDYNTAIRFFESVRNSSPDHPAPLLGMAQAYLAAGSYREATQAFRDVLALDSDNEEALDGIGRTLVLAGQYEEAIDYFKRLLAEAPSAALYNRMGVAYDLMGDGENAQIHYRAALDMDPEAISPRNNLALSLAISESYAEAIEQMERVVAHPQATDKHRQNLAFIYGMAGENDVAAAGYSENGLSPSEIARKRALYKRIRALAKAGKRAEILEYLRSGKMTGESALADNLSEPADPSMATAMTDGQDKLASGAPVGRVVPPKPLKNSRVLPAKKTRTAKASTSAKRASKWRGSSGISSVKDAFYRVQLAAYRTARTAVRGVKILKSILQDAAPTFEILVRQKRSADKRGIDYRIRTPRVPNRNAAGDLCTKVQAAGHPDCLVILHNPRVWATVDRPYSTAQGSSAMAEPGEYRLRLASYRTERGAARGRTILKKLLGDLDVDLDILVRSERNSVPGAFDYQVRTGPIKSREVGLGLCEALRKAGHQGCLFVRQDNLRWKSLAQAAETKKVSESNPADDTPRKPSNSPQDHAANVTSAGRQAAKAAAPVAVTAKEPKPVPETAQMSYRVQLASFRTEKGAARGQAKLRKLLGDRPVDLDILVRRTGSKGPGTFAYQIRTAPIDSRDEGVGLCDALKKAGHPGCLIVQHNARIWQTVAVAGKTKKASLNPPAGPAAKTQATMEPDSAAIDREAAEAARTEPSSGGPVHLFSRTPASPPKTAAQPTWRVQLASYRTAGGAVRGQAKLKKLLEDRSVDIEVFVKRLRTSGARSFDYQVRTSPIQSRDEGNALCEALKKAGHRGCLIVRHSQSQWKSLATAAGRKKASAGPPAGDTGHVLATVRPTAQPAAEIIELPSANVMEGGHTVSTTVPGGISVMPSMVVADQALDI